jgi:hypothetical protein
VLVLVSRFKSDSEADPEKQIVYPILVQRTKVSEKLSKVQWIDFRKGVRNLEAIAQLLPQPAKMLAALGVRPSTGAQGAMPNIVIALVDFLVIMGMVNIGAFIAYMLELHSLDFALLLKYNTARAVWVISLIFVCMILSGGLIYFMVRALTERSGRFASPAMFLTGLGVVFALTYMQGMLGDNIDALFRNYGIVSEALFASLPFVFFLLGVVVVGIASVFHRKDLRRWFPERIQSR